MPLPPDVEKRVQAWLSGPYDKKTKDAIENLVTKDPEGVVNAV